MINSVNYNLSIEKAYEILIYNNSVFPINIYNLDIPGYKVKIISMQEYSRIMNIKMSDLTQDGEFIEGYTNIDETKQRAVIFYNEEIESEGRKKFTVSHEFGHIVLGHMEHSKKNETEADVFASQLLLPSCILEKLVHSGKEINTDYLNKKFGLSKMAAEISIAKVGRKMEKEAKTEYEDIILNNNSQFIIQETIGTRYGYNDDYELMEEKRKEWLY